MSHLEAAQELTDTMVHGFQDEEAGGLFFMADDAER